MERVRTDFIVTNMFVSIKKRMNLTIYGLDIVIPLHPIEQETFTKVSNFTKFIFHNHYNDICDFQKVIRYVKEENLEQLMTTIFEQLTVDRITWYKILLFFNIMMHFTPLNISHRFLLKSILKFSREIIKPWICEHNGWESIEINEVMLEFYKINVTHLIPRRSQRLKDKRF